MSQSNFFDDPKLWISLASLVVSVVSAVYSGRKSSRALAISESQEKRRQPKLSIYLTDAYRRYAPTHQFFGFLISVSNPTDINNAVSKAELKITYLLKDNASAICRVQHNHALENLGGVSLDPVPGVFKLPLRIDAHQTVSGWFLFVLENDAIGKGTVDAHTLILEDTHGVAMVSDAFPVREWDA